MPFHESFPDLISGRGFDSYQSGLVARFKAHRIDYSVTYGAPSPKSAMWLDFETDDAIGRVTLWESGECDMEVLDATTGGDLLREHYEFKTTEEFFATYPKVPLLLRKMRGDILPLKE
ncbi:hypothetical protein [Luteolibacter sp.]|uniref:immunity protein TriTu family protein n=1 Tax=Luteolibacter sp. TaxID=1962973 RepID=UPI0032644BB8